MNRRRFIALLCCLALAWPPALPAAPALTNVGGGVSFGSGTNASSYTTASWTPDANVVYALCVESEVPSPITRPTPSGNGLTFTFVDEIEVEVGTTDMLVTVWWMIAASPTTGVTTIDYGAQSPIGINVIVDRLGGVDTSTPVVQSKTASCGASCTTATVTLNSAPSAANAKYGCFGINLNEAQTVGACGGGNCTQLGSVSHTAPSRSGFTEWQMGSTSGVVDESSATGNYRGTVAVEWKAAAAAATGRTRRIIN